MAPRGRSPERTAEENILTTGKAVFDYYEGIKNAFSDINKKVESSADTASKLRISFQQSFGMFEAEKGRELVRRFAEVSSELTSQGITAEKLSEAYKAVGTGINNFIIDRSGQAVESFSKLVAINNKFGVDTQTTIGIINTLTTNFNMSTEKVTQFSNKLMQFASETGQTFNKVFTDFNTSIKSFYTILDPDKAGTQFMAFQQMARGFGTTVEALMQTAAKFDSIEEGVQFGTGLNNILSAVGGSFDSMLASTMNYDDRIKLIAQSIYNSKDQIESMSEISRRAFLRQLQQTTGLGGETIQAILNNQKLVESMDTLTGKKFEQVKEAPVDKMADNFTTFQERANLYMSQYLKVGSRLEAWYDQSTKNIRDAQKKILEKTLVPVTESRSVDEMIREVKKAFSKDSLTKLLEDAKGDIQKYKENLGTALVRDTKKPKEVLKSGAIGAPRPPTGEDRKIPIPPDTIKIIKEGIAEATSKAVESAITKATVAATTAVGNREITIHVRPTDELKALISIIGAQGSTVLGSARKP